GAVHSAEHAQSGDGIVTRKNDDLDALDIVGIEREQLLHEPERDTRLRRLLEAVVLQPHVGVVVGALEDGVLFFEIEQCARANRDDQLIGRCGDGHPESIAATHRSRRRAVPRGELVPRFLGAEGSGEAASVGAPLFAPKGRPEARITPPRGSAQRRSRKRGGTIIRAEGPPRGANYSPSGGSAAAKPQAWGP